jgi:hypothetical protein
MARMPGAIWRGPVPYNSGDGDQTPMESADAMLEYRGVVVHIAAGTYEGTIAWQKNDSANVSSHFVVAKDGTIAQMVDTHDRGWTQILGNGSWLSIENAAFLPEPLTAAQVDANAKILAWAHTAHGVPIQLATSPSGRGLGHHSMGAESGVNWGHSACPGQAIKDQKPLIVARALALAGLPGGITMATIDDVYTVLSAINGGMRRVKVGGNELVVCTTEWQIANDAKLERILAGQAGSAAREIAAGKAIEAMAAAITAGGGSVETAPIVAAIREVGADVEQLHTQLAEATARADAAERRENTLLAEAHAKAAATPES